MSVNDFNPGYTMGFLVYDTHVQESSFAVILPSKTPEAQEEQGQEELEVAVPITLANTNNNSAQQSLKKMGYIMALNHTGLRCEHKGDILENEGTEYVTLDSQCDTGNGGPHKHQCSDPIKIHNLVFSGLNDITMPAGTQVFGFFINETAEIEESFAVTFINGAIPLTPDQKPPYNR